MANSTEFDPAAERPSSPETDSQAPLSSESLPVEESFTVEGFSGEDLELAYQRALESIDSWESVASRDEAVLDQASSPLPTATSEVADLESIDPQSVEVAAVTGTSGSQQIPEDSEPLKSEAVPVEELSLHDTTAATIPLSAASPGARRPKVEAESEEARVSPAQVIEAVLFVGGPPLTARKLAGLLRGSNDVTAVERTIDELNQEYAAQDRPYEIRLGDGGYRIDLRPEFERLRLRVFGGGPREVRLSQELLEVLALVAYQQPISVAEIEELGRKNPESHLRQLLRRELIALRRSESNPKEVRYHTTSRFLSLFGLGSLDELPQPEDVELK